MRRAYNNVDFIEDDKNAFIGISLGYDFCAEHEWGIKGIKYGLKMSDELNPKNFGLTFRTINRFDEEKFVFFKHEKKIKNKVYYFACLIFHSYIQEYNQDNLPHDLKDYLEIMIPNKWDKDGKKIITAWDEKGFAIIVRDENNVKHLEELFQSFKTKDICIGLFGGGVFQNAHLTIAIKSRMPKEINEHLKKHDLESYEILKIKAKWEEKVKKSGKSYNDYTCISPKFFNFYNKEKEKELMKKYNTKYNFHIWINASNDNYGWYTGEQVKKWMKSKEQIGKFKEK
jgi:hypothetical protein